MEINREFSALLEARLARFQPLIQILVGPRQVGKSTAARAIASKYKDRCTYIAFDDPVPAGGSNEEKLRFAWNQARQIASHNILILDEVQNVKNWSAIIKSLYEVDRSKKRLSVCVLGSSALELSLTGHESLLGRFEIIHATHWTGREHKDAFDWTIGNYLELGGYPILGELIDEWSGESIERVRRYIRDAILEPVITRDILALKPTLNSSLLRQTLELVLTLPAREVSFTKILGQLRDRGNATTIKTYLELLERAFLIKMLPRYASAPIRTRTSTPKLIPLAPALIHAFIPPSRMRTDPAWFGDVFEAAVIARINALGFDLYYWNNSRLDVDLVIKRDNEVLALEIKANRKADWKGLKAFKNEFPKAAIAVVDREMGAQLLMGNEVELRDTIESTWRAAL